MVRTIIGSLCEMMMKSIIAAVVCYGGTVALLYVGQRSLQYFPERRRTARRRLICLKQKRRYSTPLTATIAVG